MDDKEFGELKTVNLREAWQHEAHNFTPWLADNIDKLGDALGMDLELVKREKDVGNFSLDLLAEEIGSGRKVVIENQLEQTNHDHLGKLLTYASGVDDASVVVWVAGTIRDEHRAALEWLNRRTGEDTHFFGVEVELLQIDNSKPAPHFKIIVSPNDWQKETRQQAKGVSDKKFAYKEFFRAVIDEVKQKNFQTNRTARASNKISLKMGLGNMYLRAVFARDSKISTELYIDTNDIEHNKHVFDALVQQKEDIEKELGVLSWERTDEQRYSRIAMYRDGVIDDREDWDDIRAWIVKNVLDFERVFKPRLKKILRS